MKRNKRSIIALFTMIVMLFTISGTVLATDQQLSTDETATRVREIIELRTTNSETYLMSDGTRQCVVFSDDKYYETGNALRLIDNSIVAESPSEKLSASGTSVTYYKNAANSHKTTFSGSGTPEISIEKDGYSVSFSPSVASATLSSASTASRSFAPASSNISIGKVNDCAPLNEVAFTGSNTATYEDVFTDTDLVYVVNNNALKEYIILNSTAAPNAFSFTYTMQGLTLQTVEGALCFTDSEGIPVFTLGNLFAVDARGAFTEAVTYSYITNPRTGAATITVTLDEEYLSSADRAFPVVIDPTISISSVQTADACVCSKYPTTNYYTGYTLRTGYDDDYGIRRSYIKFNIPDTVPLNDITYATLEIEKVSGATPNVRAYRVTGSWSSNTITWNNKPGYTLTGGSNTSSVQSNGTWYTMYVTNVVKAWANAATPNYGFLIEDLIEDDPDQWTTFYSSDADSPHKPELYIFYVISDDSGDDSPPVDTTPFVDAWLMAFDTVEYDIFEGYVYFNGFFEATIDFVENYRQGTVSTNYYTATTKEALISNMQHCNMFFIGTHGTQNSLQLADNLVISSSDFVGVDLSNLEFVMLYACECAKGGLTNNNTADNLVEQLVDSGVETVVGFEIEIPISENKAYAEQFRRVAAYYKGYSVQHIIDNIPHTAFASAMPDSAVVGGNGNLIIYP